MRPYHGLGEQGKGACISWEQMLNFEGNKGAKKILVKREYKKTNLFSISGEQANLFQESKGTGAPWRVSIIIYVHYF